MRGSGTLKKYRQPIPYGRHWITLNDVKSVGAVLKSDWITQGPAIAQFEKALAAYCGARYAVAVSSGTAALHLACLGLGLTAGSEAITTPISFLATSNAVIYTGAKPVFAEIDYDSINLAPHEIQKKITRRTKVIIPVHFGGMPAKMEAIHRIAQEKNLLVLEDACHALGAEYISGKIWKRVGDCTHSDACVFSFHPVKSITTGEGGAITTNSKTLYEKMLRLRSHGVTRQAEQFINPENAIWCEEEGSQIAPWYYEMQELGFNYRITDMQAALGICQLERLDDFIGRRREIADAYHRGLKSIEEIEFQSGTVSSRSAYHLFVIKIKADKKMPQKRGRIFSYLKRAGINPQVHYIPIHLQPYYARFGYKRGDFPVSEKYYEAAISLPIYPLLKKSQISHVVRTLKVAFENYAKSF